MNTTPPPPAPAATDPPAAAVRPTAPLQPAAARVAEPRPPAPPKAAAPPPVRERWSGGRLVAVAVTAVLIVGSLVAALVLSRGSDEPNPAAAKAANGAPVPAPPKAKRRASKPAPLEDQVQTLDDLMKTSEKGRAAAVKGQMKAAIANRSGLLRDLQRLSTGVSDARLKAGLRDFTAAIRESLRQNRECASKCSTAELNKVTQLKQQAVTELNPLLRKYAKTSYRSQEI